MARALRDFFKKRNASDNKVLRWIFKHVRPWYETNSTPKGKKKETIIGIKFRIPFGRSGSTPQEAETSDNKDDNNEVLENSP